MAGFKDLPTSKSKDGSKLPTTPKGGGGLASLSTPKDKKKGTGGIFGIPGTGTLKKAGGGLLGSVMKVLGAPQQAVFRVGSGVGELAEGNFKSGLTELGRGVKEVATLGHGVEDIDFAQATTSVKDREAGLTRKLPFGVNMGANLLLDPTLPAAFLKGGKGAKEAIRLVEGVAGKEVAEKIAKEGLSSLGAKERSLLPGQIGEQAASVGATGGKRSLKEVAQGVTKPKNMGLMEGAERQATKTIQTLERAEKAAPTTAVGRLAESAPKFVAEKAHLAEGVKALKSRKLSVWADDALRPRSGIIRNYGEHGQKLAAEVKALGGERLAHVARRSGDVSSELQARMSRLDRVVGKDDNQLLGAALRGEGWAVDTIKDTDLNEVYEFAVGLEGKTDSSFNVLAPVPKPRLGKNMAAAVAKPVGGGESAARIKLRDILAKQGQTPEGLAPHVPGLGGLPGSTTPAARKTLDELTNTPISDTNPLRDVLDRHFQAIHGEETKKYLTRFESEIIDPTTNEGLVQRFSSIHDVPEGWEKLKSKFMGDAYAPPEIAKEVDRLGALLDNDSAIQGFEALINKYDKFWKSAATSLPVGAAFTLRNARGNFFLNWLDGLHTIGPYKEAASIQRKAAQVMKGEKFADEIVAKGVKTVMKEQLTARQYRIWDLAMQNRVVGANYFDIDLAFSGLSKAGRIKGVKSGENVVKRGAGRVVDAGKKGNNAVENNAKLANFIHNLDRYGDAKIATEHVHKFLFDYSDLTPFEQRKVRKFVPFYTFMRKNIPLQVEQAFIQPGKVGLRLKAGEALSDPLPDEAPSYLERGGASTLPGWAQKTLGAAGQVVLTPDNPMSAAANIVDPFAKLATALPALARGEAPESLPAEVWRPMLSVIGGGRGAPAKALFEEAAGVSTFTGGDLPPAAVRTRLARALLPMVGRMEGLKPKEDEAIRQFLLRQAGIKVRDLE